MTFIEECIPDILERAWIRSDEVATEIMSERARERRVHQPLEALGFRRARKMSRTLADGRRRKFILFWNPRLTTRRAAEREELLDRLVK